MSKYVNIKAHLNVKCAFFLVFILSGLFFYSYSYSNEQPMINYSQDDDTLSIFTWNIYMLPRFINTEQNKRLEPIIQEINTLEHDVIVLQELFINKFFQLIKEGIAKKYPYSVRSKYKNKFLNLSNGIVIFSRYPIQYVKEICFINRKGVDKLARKGAILAEVTIPKSGNKVYVIGTHLQADTDKKCYPEVRNEQLEMIDNELIQPYDRSDASFVLAGDFNISKSNTTYYSKLLKLLRVKDATKKIKKKEYTYDGKNNPLTKSKAQLFLDYILVKSKKIKVISSNIIRMKSKWKESLIDLSDHYAVNSNIVISSK